MVRFYTARNKARTSPLGQMFAKSVGKLACKIIKLHPKNGKKKHCETWVFWRSQHCSSRFVYSLWSTPMHRKMGPFGTCSNQIYRSRGCSCSGKRLDSIPKANSGAPEPEGEWEMRAQCSILAHPRAFWGILGLGHPRAF